MATPKKSKKQKEREHGVGYEFGRPTMYRDEFAQMLIDYFSEPPYIIKIEKVFTPEGVVEREVEKATDFKSLAGFAIKIGVHRDTLHEWAKIHPYFSDAYKRCKQFQENFLAINGNKDLIKTSFAIFTAKNVIDWTDKQEIKNDTTLKTEGFTINYVDGDNKPLKSSN